MQPERVKYRSRTTGDRGYVYQDGDRVRIKLDRPNDDVSRPFVASEWIEEVEVRNFTPMQMAQVAFVADRLLCTFLGLHADAKLDWISLKEERRIEFMKKGPRGAAIRAELFEAVMTVLRRYC
jgi:hypothetical protein